MRADLIDNQRPEHQDRGQVTGADGCGYSRQGTKLGRRAADALVAAGVPLILDLYGHGRFEWADGKDAQEVWHEVRPYVIATEPTAKQLAKHEMWTAGVWTADSARQVLYLTGQC